MIIDVEILGEQSLRYESDVIPRVGEVLMLMGGIDYCDQRTLEVVSVSHLLSETIQKIRHTQVCVDTIPVTRQRGQDFHD